ncbi:MAG TPA: metalloregulator ArsR/SmtB family transcription factor [Mycobacteriales bacterium]|jgi:DNA-binding transcriptional ArsR family regulator|nr:metalloregulator ArsR/SmtB family transcription factor [Mycobacteriales bacterium]
MGEQGVEPLELDLPTVLSALADQGRLAIVRALAVAGEAACGEIHQLAALDCGKSTMSHHTKVLREAGVIHTRVAGTRRYVSLRRDQLQASFPGLLDAVLGAPRGAATAAT